MRLDNKVVSPKELAPASSRKSAQIFSPIRHCCEPAEPPSLFTPTVPYRILRQKVRVSEECHRVMNGLTLIVSTLSTTAKSPSAL